MWLMLTWRMHMSLLSNLIMPEHACRILILACRSMFTSHPFIKSHHIRGFLPLHRWIMFILTIILIHALTPDHPMPAMPLRFGCYRRSGINRMRSIGVGFRVRVRFYRNFNFNRFVIYPIVRISSAARLRVERAARWARQGVSTLSAVCMKCAHLRHRVGKGV